MSALEAYLRRLPDGPYRIASIDLHDLSPAELAELRDLLAPLYPGAGMLKRIEHPDGTFSRYVVGHLGELAVYGFATPQVDDRYHAEDEVTL